MSPDRARSQEDVLRDVARALEGHLPLRELPIAMRIHEGSVTMSGRVRSWKQARDAGRLALTVAGVAEVRNELVVDPSDADRRSDQELAAAASDAIRTNLLVRTDIQTTVEDGVVTLQGVVPYASQRYDAEVAMERLSGLRGVVNLVRVAPPGHVDLTVARETATLALKRHATADALGLTFAERDGTLEVSGVLDSSEEKTCVLSALRDVAGVRQVLDEIRIVSPS